MQTNKAVTDYISFRIQANIQNYLQDQYYNYARTENFDNNKLVDYYYGGLKEIQKKIRENSSNSTINIATIWEIL